VDADSTMPTTDRWRWVTNDLTARRAFSAAIACAIPVWWLVGRNQWFIRDDWGFIITRERMRGALPWDAWLLSPQDGHVMAPPILTYHWLKSLFGIDSYWPYLLVLLATHLGIVALTRIICRRLGVSEWTNTMVGALLLVFGAGWENIVFAIQITYNLSLLCFLAHVLLTDHDGKPDWRDGLGLLLGCVGIASSGFGPFFIVGIGLVLAARRRWLVLAGTVGPMAAAFVGWWLWWGSDAAAAQRPSLPTQIPLFVIRSLDATLRGMTGFPGLGGLAAVGMLVLLAKQLSARTWGTPLLPAALTATTLVMLAGVGLQRAGFGLEIAESSRYVYMSAVLLAPLFALLCDSIAERFAAPATAVVRALLAVAIVINIAWLHGRSSDWARVAESERLSLELLAGVPNLAERLAPDAEPLQVSKDVRIADIPMLVAEGAVVPRQPANPAEQQLLDRLLAPTTP
jgi:hypothetical protein